MIEKRPVIGSPVRCGEATSNRHYLVKFGDISEESIETDLDGVLLYFDDVCAEARLPEVGIVLDQLKFDVCLVQNAEKARPK